MRLIFLAAITYIPILVFGQHYEDTLTTEALDNVVVKNYRIAGMLP